MNNHILDQIDVLIKAGVKQKEAIRTLCLKHKDNWSPILLHDCIHHCGDFEKVPARFDNESEHAFESRCIYMRRRLVNETRLAGCLLSLLEEKDDRESATIAAK